MSLRACGRPRTVNRTWTRRRSGVVPQARDVTFALETIQRERHRGRRDPHVPREVVHGRRIDFVEVIEDAGLMAAEQPAGRRIAHVSRVAGEVDARIERQHLLALPPGRQSPASICR